MKSYIIHTDAKVGKNKEVWIGYVIYDSDKLELLRKVEYIDMARNSTWAETFALVKAAQELRKIDFGPGIAVFRCDCESAVQAITLGRGERRWALDLKLEMHELLRDWEWGVMWLPRSKNRIVDVALRSV